MKKLIALLLAACLMLGLMTTAFAADEKSNDIVTLGSKGHLFEQFSGEKMRKI